MPANIKRPPDGKTKYLKEKIRKLKKTPARDKRTLNAKIDVVGRLMAPGTDAHGNAVPGMSFEKARKEVGLSRTAFNKGIKEQSLPFFERDKKTGTIIKERGRNKLALSPYLVIYSDASPRKVSAAGTGGAILAQWSKAVSTAQDHRTSKKDRKKAVETIEELSRKRIYDVYGNRIYLASNLETIDDALSQMTPEQREEFDDRRMSGKV